MNNELRRRYVRIFHRFGNLMKFQPFFREITKGEYMLLQKIYSYTAMHPDAKGICVSDIASRLCVSPPAVSRMLRALESKGYVSRLEDERDRRSTFINLTEQGLTLYEGTSAELSAFTDDVCDRMGAGNMLQLADLLEHFAHIMEEYMDAFSASDDSRRR